MKDWHAAPPRLRRPVPPPSPLSNWIFYARTALRLPFSVCSECAFLILGPQYTGGVKGREIMNCADMEVTSACTETLRPKWMPHIEAFCPKYLLSRVGEITVDVFLVSFDNGLLLSVNTSVDNRATRLISNLYRDRQWAHKCLSYTFTRSFFFVRHNLPLSELLRVVRIKIRFSAFWISHSDLWLMQHRCVETLQRDRVHDFAADWNCSF